MPLANREINILRATMYMLKKQLHSKQITFRVRTSQVIMHSALIILPQLFNLMEHK